MRIKYTKIIEKEVDLDLLTVLNSDDFGHRESIELKEDRYSLEIDFFNDFKIVALYADDNEAPIIRFRTKSLTKEPILSNKKIVSLIEMTIKELESKEDTK